MKHSHASSSLLMRLLLALQAPPAPDESVGTLPRRQARTRAWGRERRDQERGSRIVSGPHAGTLPPLCDPSPRSTQRRAGLGRRWAYRAAFGCAPGHTVPGPGLYL